ncbi:MAG TPA: NifU family protein [Longimicrobiales bacterium]|nr:NifU family protein [Longimicrobiales bacterium]
MSTTDPHMSTVDPATVGARIEALVQQLSALDSSPAKAQAQELVRLLMSLYGAGLSRVLDIVRTEGGGPEAVLDRLAAEPLLASLLVLHDLHPHPVQLRVERALAELRPHLPAATNVTLVAVEQDAVRVAVGRAASGQPRAGEAVRAAIERAIQEAAPEITAIHIEGAGEPLIQIGRSSSTAAAR